VDIGLEKCFSTLQALTTQTFKSPCPTSEERFSLKQAHPFDLESQFRNFKESGGRNWMEATLRFLGAGYLLKAVGKDASVDAVLKVAGSTQVSRLSDRLEDAERRMGKRQRMQSSYPLSQLYTELRDKLILEGKDLEERQFWDQLSCC
jgi:hypothetical protein